MLRPATAALLLLAALVSTRAPARADDCRAYSVEGLLAYRDLREGAITPRFFLLSPAANVKVEVLAGSGQVSRQAITHVDADGRWEASFSLCFADGLAEGEKKAAIYAVYRLETAKWRVVDADDDVYIFATAEFDHPPGTVELAPVIVPYNSAFEEATWVFESAREVWDFVEGESGWNWGSQMKLRYPDGGFCPGATHGCAAGGDVFVRMPDALTVYHEIGHAIQHRAWRGKNGNGHHLGERFHRFSEDWANFVRLAVQRRLDLIEPNPFCFVDSVDWPEEALMDVLDDDVDFHHDFPDVDAADRVSWEFVGLPYTLWHMSDQEIDQLPESPAIREFVREILEIYPQLPDEPFEELMLTNCMEL